MRLCGFDVETWGEKPEYALQPNRLRTKEAWVTCAAFIVPGVRECSWRSPGVEKLRAMLKLCATQRYRIVAWNAPFDIAWLIAMGLREEVFACQWLDAMLLYKHLTISPKFDPGSKISYGLKAAVTLYLPQHAGYEQDVVFGAETEEDKQKLEAYNLADTRRTLDLAELFLKQLSPQQRRMVLVEAACLPMVAETLVEGIAIDRAAAEALDTSLEETIDISYAHLALHSADVTKKVLASPKQLAELLCEKWHIPPVSYTDTGAVSTDRESLLIMATKDHRAGLVNDHREAQGNRTKFVSNTLDSLDYNGDGCVRPAHRIYGTYTGRMSISSTQGRGNGMVQTGVALHQWKRSPEFRNLIRAPAGYKLLEWDFAGQEFRWMAVVSGDEAMLSKCLA